ncbi:hypothetical protein HYPSUDRAFT_55033 [Hypholoma sublateritium FD-334 SS-4]|uniref:Integrase zinc-binding domain-containing protein n=1 Tax=Hypholoma sublateritium (strain FD-334 SS-4) TaxID=945553 RepID=A0A0D2PQH1_HYPSF|nr:hypothetical protein HYPSUDRAFT_55033 [Hypholoma sublateritium FD-334 SS-4]
MAPPSSEFPPPDIKWANASERPGFPSYAQYKQVETAYLQSLTPRRQGKALISQSLFDRIWDVLHQPEAQGETAQFRFWARKMFTISKTHRVTLGVIDDRDETPHEVLLHDNLLVAIQEQLYDLLCYCHGSTGHGGRDKTCALIRKHYTWVPKDLVSNFIKACPTCIMKKCGSLDTVNIASQINEPKPLEETTLPGIRDFFQNMYPGNVSVPGSLPGDATPWPLMGVSRESPMSPTLLADDPLEAAYREALFRAREAKASLAGLGGPSGSRLPQTFPMSREVSLYKGLPNGWQFRHADYASAYAEFMRTKDLPVIEEPGPKRPRVPSILPLWGPDQYPHPEFETLEGEITDAEHLPCLELDSHAHGSNGRSSGESMQYLLMTSEVPKDKAEYVPQIDPVLMQYSHTQEPASSSRAADAEVGGPESTGLLAASANHASSSSIKRAAAPLRINLEFPADKTFQALFAYRESLGEGNLTPDSPLTAWHPGNPSPTSSDSSSSSHLSAYAMTTPASSALPTPVDECRDEGSSNMVKGKQRQVMPEYTPEEELSGGIQEVCALRSG